MHFLIIEYVYLGNKSYDYFAFSLKSKAEEAIKEYIQKYKNPKYGKLNFKIIPLKLDERIT